MQTVRTAALKVEHLEGFMRCMTLLASIRRTYGQRVACAMAAAHVAKIIVKMIGDQVNATHWGIPTLEEQDAEEERRAIAEGRPSLMKSNTFRRQREEVIPAIGPNGEAPLVPWFDNPLEWWKWKVPDEAIPMLKDETRSKYPRMHAVALKQPEQMVHFLKYLIGEHAHARRCLIHCLRGASRAASRRLSRPLFALSATQTQLLLTSSGADNANVTVSGTNKGISLSRPRRHAGRPWAPGGRNPVHGTFVHGRAAGSPRAARR